MKGGSRAPSPGLVVAVVALFVALGGTAYAAASLPRNSVGTAQLKNAAVTKEKINKRTVAALKGRRGPMGVRGLQGIQGVQGKRGPSAAFAGSRPGAAFTGTGSLGSLSVPAGSYVIAASTWAWNITSPGGATVLIDCTLTAGSDTDEVRAELAKLDDPGDAQSLAFNVAHTFSAAGTIQLSCNDFSQNVNYTNVRITAIQVGSLTNGALGP